MPFDLSDGRWPLAPVDIVLLGYVGFQALRGGARGALAMVAAATAFAAALAVALAVSALTLPLPLGPAEASLVGGIVAFLVTHALLERIVAILLAPAALSLAFLPGGKMVERMAGLLAGGVYGIFTAGLALALARAHLPPTAVGEWLAGAPLGLAIAAAGEEGLLVLSVASALVLARFQERLGI